MYSALQALSKFITKTKTRCELTVQLQFAFSTIHKQLTPSLYNASQ
jgi:hypothetical protein